MFSFTNEYLDYTAKSYLCGSFLRIVLFYSGGHEIIHRGQSGARKLNCSAVEIVVTNYYFTILDAWEREIQYISRPPYESYILRSSGPDGTFGNEDDIIAGRGD